MIALVQDECVDKKKWITDDEFATVLTIAESTPGPIAINCATYPGYAQSGILGSAAATFGVVLPSFVIIFLISSFFNNLLEIEIVANAFTITVLIIACLVMLAIDFLGWNFSTIYMLLIAGVLGVMFYQIQKLVKGGKAK